MPGCITDVPGIKVGQIQNEEALTGCTAILTEQGAVCGVDVRGAAPGTRETDLLSPINMVQEVHAICLSGGSAYGLDAASGVMRYLEEQGMGLQVGFGVVPIVPAAVLFDLSVGNPKVRPDATMGYEAASVASSSPIKQGNAGAGCGASVAKVAGFDRAMKGGIGTASRTLSNGVVIGAIVAVNAVGEVRDPRTGEVLAGVRSDDGTLLDIYTCMEKMAFSLLEAKHDVPSPGTNTTIGAIASNVALTKAEANKIAQMAHDGFARTIYPVHTMHDGDTIFALGTGGERMPVDLIGAIAAEVMAEAVVNAITHATDAGGLPSWKSRVKLSK
ncbi:P1 family peptidase [Brevibacillus daliensis]|uniref:P1 family peptidase n=1 Tax=Brevibacillus daliensis TaxID=2892995 RepID=UPI001E31CAE0|nr:P1 family peptidase [Brevibacillus daliensis]